MRTNPSATSEYMTPARSPPKSTSVKKDQFIRTALRLRTEDWRLRTQTAIATVWPPSGAARLSPLRSSVLSLSFIALGCRHAEVGLDDLRVAADLVRRAVGDFAAVVENSHAVRN